MRGVSEWYGGAKKIFAGGSCITRLAGTFTHRGGGFLCPGAVLILQRYSGEESLVGQRLTDADGRE